MARRVSSRLLTRALSTPSAPRETIAKDGVTQISKRANGGTATVMVRFVSCTTKLTFYFKFPIL